MFNFEWWRNKDNRDGASAIVAALKVIVPAGIVVAVALLGWFGWSDSKEPKPDQPNIQTGDNSAVNIGTGDIVQNVDNSTVIHGITLEQYEQGLVRRGNQIRAELEQAHSEDKALLQKQLDQIAYDKRDLQNSFDRTIEELRLLRLRLNDFAGQIPREQLEAAQTALYAGNRSLADDLLAKVQQSAADTIKVAAEAAFLRGEIAEQEVRWYDAARLYGEAARFDPHFDNLHSAREFAWRMGKYSKALYFGKEMLALARQSDDLEQLAVALNEHGLTLDAMGRYDEAEPLYREALEIDRKTLGEAHPSYATHLNNLATLLDTTGRFDEAEPLYREALEIDRKTLGEAHPRYAIHLNNLAELLRTTGRYDEAEPLYREALEINRKTLGEAHPDYAIRLNNLALLLQATGRYDEAEPLYHEALKVFEAALGAEHPNTQTARKNLEIFLAERPD